MSVRTSKGNREISAGNNIGIHGGVGWRFHQNADIRSTIRYAGVTQVYENGSVSFTRYPIEIGSNYFIGRHALGLGFTHHLSPTLEVEIKNVAKAEADFKNASGYFAQYMWTYSEPGALGDIYLAFRYTSITYRFELSGAHEDYDGSNFGVDFGIVF